MTIYEIKARYGSNEYGYVLCAKCPLDGLGLCPNFCTGQEECWEAIKDYFDKNGDPDADIVNSDAVNHPAHYQGKHECIDEMIALFGVESVKAFCKCNVYKYRFRAANKNGQEDLDKADFYMDYLMKLEKGENGNGKEA